MSCSESLVPVIVLGLSLSLACHCERSAAISPYMFFVRNSIFVNTRERLPRRYASRNDELY